MIARISLLLALLILAASNLRAQTITPEKGQVTTVRGIGGWANVQYYFSPGETVRVHYKAKRQLATIVAIGDGQLAKNKSTRSGDLEFTVADGGIVVLHFVNDRNGSNVIDYEITRLKGNNTAKETDSMKQRP